MSNGDGQGSARRISWTDRCVYWIARIVIGTVARVPEWFGYRFASAFGRLWFRFDSRRRRYALKFLGQAYPDLSERERLRMGASATANLFMVPLDLARMTRLLGSGGKLEDVVECRESGPQLRQMPRPFFALTAHLGSWEIAAVATAELAGGVHAIARLIKNPLLNDWLQKNREIGGLVIHPRRGGFRPLARALEGGVPGLQVVDQNQRLRGVFAPFFGKIASCERGAMSLALRRGYPVIILASLRCGYRFRFELIVEERFTPEVTGNKQQDLLRAVTRVNQALERMIRRAPDQYLWIHDRYRTQPEADDSTASESLSEDEPTHSAPSK